MFIRNLFLLLVALLLTQTGSTNESSDPDQLLKKVLTEIIDQNIDQALIDINSLIEIAPNFTVAKIIKSDLLASKSKVINQFGYNFGGKNDDLDHLKLELQKRIQLTSLEKLKTINTKYKFLLDSSVPYFLFVDLPKSRLLVFRNKDRKLEHISDHYVSIGKKGYGKKIEGDQRTPVGVYFLQKKIQNRLPDKYGDGAYPINYPNIRDKMNGNTGFGIWIHGVPKTTFSRPPYSSDGCIVMTNQDLKKIEHILNTPNTPVVVSDVSIDDILMKETIALSSDIDKFKKQIESWRITWEKGNFDDYIKFYSKRAVYNLKEYESWTKFKSNVFSSSMNIEVKINNMSFFEHPGSDLILVKFNQHYKSNLIESEMTKQQLWTKENNEWKILSEGKFI